MIRDRDIEMKLCQMLYRSPSKLYLRPSSDHMFLSSIPEIPVLSNT